ncbi:hypothetical protein TWF694_011796 [Orbilia ellipsospora]|uniref:Uncharacterized protein n=1 Tax=Orbilia ellipsospora TaxID=2528407 RepID=A0AAV9X692_9PEZI
MPFQTIFGNCFPFSAEHEQVDQSEHSSNEEEQTTPRRPSHIRSRSERSLFSLRMSADGSSRVTGADIRSQSPPPIPTIRIDDDIDSLPQRPHAVRSHSSPSSARDAQRGNSPYGPTLTIHDADLANELLGSNSTLVDGRYSFRNGSFVPRPLSCLSSHSRSLSMPHVAAPSPFHTHSRAARSLGNLHVNTADLSMSPFLAGLSPIYRSSSPTTTIIDSRRDSMSIATGRTSFEMEEEEMHDVQAVTIPVPSSGENSETSSVDIPAEGQQSSTECKEALERIKVAMEEKESLERRLRELERLISGKAVARRSQSEDEGISNSHVEVESREPPRVEVTSSESAIEPTAIQAETRSISTRATSFEDDASILQEEPASPIVLDSAPPAFSSPPQMQRQRPRLPQLQTSLPLPTVTPTGNEERQTPSTAVRLTSAVSRIANWIFGDEDHSDHPNTPTDLASAQTPRRQQHNSVQPYQLIQVHHLALTPTSPQYSRRVAHLSAPVGPSPASASVSTPVVMGYQQRWRPRNVEDVDPVPPYYEQDPNPSPGFVFFPQNSLMTPLATPTSPVVNMASQMYAQAV